MKRLLSAFILTAVATVCVTAQPNLVPNGSFESYTTCPNGFSQVTNATGWLSWNTTGTPDYYNTCVTGSNTPTVPTSIVGYQWPASGNGYMGIFNTTVTNTVKEYLTRQITPLQVGMMYEVSMSVSLANFSAGGTNDLAVFFYDAGPTSYSGIGLAPIAPKVSWTNMVITDTQNWVRLSKTFIADSAYDNIAIGGSLSPSNVTYTPITSGGNSITYYLVDSIVVKVYDSLSFVFNDSLKCSGDTVNIAYISSKKKQSNNVFTLQLSNASGSFASPVNIGSVTSDTSGMITAVIPANTATGTGYKIRIVASNYADTSEASINIKIGNGPIVKPVANNNGPVCANDTLKLSATTTTAGVTWSWTGPNSFGSALQYPKINSPLPVHSGDYIVTARLYGCAAKDTTTVVVNAGTGPSGTSATSNAPICAGDTLKLFGTANGTGNSYSWTGPNSFTSNIQNPVLPVATAAMSGDYVLYAGNGNCISRDTVTVVVKPRPANFGATSNAPICTGETLNFTASSTSPGVTYTWTGPNGFNSNSATPFVNGATAAQNGNYYVTGTLNGCPLNDTVSVTVKPLPAKPTANVNTPVCAGETMNFTVATSTTGVSWAWTGPGSYSSTVQNPSITNTTTAMSGDYIVAAMLNGCSLTDTATVLVKPMPAAVTLTNNGPVCAGDTLKVFSTASTTGATYSWAGPVSFSAGTQNAAIANATTAATGWYKMTVNLNGCVYKDSTNATVHPIPSMPNITFSNPLCVGETLNLGTGAIAGAVYSWSGPNNFSSSSQNTARTNMQFGDTGLYKLTTTVNGCTSPQNQAAIKINPVPFVVIFPSPSDSICQGDPANFTALPNNHGGTPAYQWYVNGQYKGTGTSFSSSTFNDQDIVHCNMTENTKCSAPYTDPSNDITMNVLPWLAPSVSISASPNRPLKENEYVTFTATVTNAGNSPQYQWKRNGQDIVGATGSVWSANTLNDNDSISVELVSNYKCPQPASAVSNGIVVKVLTTVGGLKGVNGLTLYPNPNNGSFTLKGKVTPGKALFIEVTNALGQLVYRDDARADNGILHEELTLPQIATGVYMLKLMGDDGITVMRFSVQ